MNLVSVSHFPFALVKSKTEEQKEYQCFQFHLTHTHSQSPLALQQKNSMEEKIRSQDLLLGGKTRMYVVNRGCMRRRQNKRIKLQA